MQQSTTIPLGGEQANEWQDGAPLSIPSEAVIADMMAYRRLTCAGCGKRGMRAAPQHNASGGYRVLCSCRVCRHDEVM